MKPIYVCSKGRPDGPTFKTLANAGLPYTVVLEPDPEESTAYLSAMAENFKDAPRNTKTDIQFLTLEERGRGLAYSRQAALSHARLMGHDWYWMLDDDIKGFFRTVGGKTVRISASDALNDAERLFVEVAGTGQAGLEYQQFAWSSTKPVTWNSYADVCVCINTRVPANYRTHLPFKSDRDFTLQVLSLGFNVAKLGMLSFAVPKNGSNKGGLHDIYATDGAEEHASREMERLWGSNIAKFHRKKDGRPDVKINWRAFGK